MTPRLTSLLSSLCWLFVLTACGGGGGGGSGSNSPAPRQNIAPVATFELSSSGTTAPLVVTVDATPSSDNDGIISSFAWDFAGEQAIGAVAQYTFTEPGDFLITLTVTDDDGASASSSRTVTVDFAGDTATVSGTVRILSSTAVDSDVNDRLTVGASNNTFDFAQPLPTPVTLGGYANVPGAGESTGNLFASGDPSDFFQVSLNGGELIALAIAEPDADLDLRLWDDQRRIVDVSMGFESTESIAVVVPGNYFIEVTPFSGASNYVLYVGQDVSSNSLSRPAQRLSDPFIAGELLIKHRPRETTRQRQGGPTEIKLQDNRRLTARYAEPPGISGPGLYQLEKNAQRDRTFGLSLPQGSTLSADQTLRMQTLMALKTARRSPQIEYAELNMLARSHSEPNDSFYGSQWHYQAINLPVAWDTTTGSADVIVAVVDSGVLANHPDLRNKLVPGYDFISDDSRALDGDGIDPDASDPGDREFGGSSSFHGTHVAGTVGADSNNAQGVAGVSWQTRIMPMRALGKGGGTTFDIIQAVRYAAGLSNSSGNLPAQRADIINLSLGSTFSSVSEQDTYSEAIAAGVIIVASAGNDSTSAPSYPAAYDGVIGVSGTTITNAVASYSNFGNNIDIAAPGGSNVTDLNGDGIGDGVLSTMGDDSNSGPIEFGYVTLTGTSMAAPHVAGVVALMKAVYPTLTPAQFNAALVAGDLTDDLGEPGRDDRYGYGLVNAQKAVITATQLAGGQASAPGPILTSSASTLNFGSLLTTLTLSLQNVGTGNISIDNISSTEPWVDIVAPDSSDGLGQYSININRSGLSDGAYQAQIDITSSAENLSVGLIMQVSSANLSANAGLLYIILIDDNGETVGPPELVTANQGEYPFSINNIPPGQYRLFAGSDADDDELLCDAGEACGAYPTLDSPAFIAVNEDLTGVDFESGFRVNLNTLAQTSDTSSSAGPTNQEDDRGTFFQRDIAISKVEAARDSTTSE